MPFVEIGDGRFKHVERKRASKTSGFIGVDGEGVNDSSGNHLYTLLAASDGSYIEDTRTGLDYRRCFDYLLGLSARSGNRALVGFSFNYDCEMMLKSTPLANQCELWDTHETAWKDGNVRWYLERIPSKYLFIQRTENGKKESARIWDVFGFFQTSFVNAIKEWNVATKEEANNILEMKDKRGDFANVDGDAIRRYCLHECVLLEALMDKLRDAFDRASIPLSRFDGAGAAASGLLTKYDCKRANAHHPSMEGIYLSAYFGGRFELFRVGQLGTVHNADINSAYPYAATFLPTMHGMWEPIRDLAKPQQFSLYKVRWDIDSRERLMPFPHRAKDGRITYPLKGVGWYHGIEVSAALNCYGRGNGIHIESGYSFQPRDSIRPFDFLHTIYDERRKRKASGDASQLPMKLAMNSVYGKLAQGYGYRGKRPAFQNYYWAGLITATTRAMILEAAYPIRDKLVQIATDGIYALKMPEVREGKALGEWECGTVDAFFSAQPGVYRCVRDGETKARNRGFSTREIDFDALEQAYARMGIGAYVSFRPTRFLTFGASNRGTKPYGVWRPVDRKLSIGLGRKHADETVEVWKGPQELFPLPPAELESYPYKRKQTWTDFPDAHQYLTELEEI